MRKQLSDEQLDKILRSLTAHGRADAATVSEAASSPAIWWNVQRHIKESQKGVRSPWPPVVKAWRWFAIGIPAAAAAAFLIAIYPPPPAVDTIEIASNVPAIEVSAEVGPAEQEFVPAVVRSNPSKHGTTSKSAMRKAVSRKNVRRALTPSPAPAASKEEIKSEFIALSYASDPESGQIVRVRVPRSMMVTLGLVASVETPTTLVDAEVLLGDDGLTHAIRFIHQN